MAEREQRIARTTAEKLAKKLSSCRQKVENKLDDPTMLRKGWQKAPYNPMQLLAACKHVRLKDGFTLEAYQYYESTGGNGFVFAIPANETLPEPPKGLQLDFSERGHQPTLNHLELGMPKWMRTDADAFLEGDGSPISYFEASILSRELRELGAMWHGCGWSTHLLLTSEAAVDKVIGGDDATDRKWEWGQEKPTDWRPVVRVPDGGCVTAEFYTYSGLGREAIQLHRDTFHDGYAFETESEVVGSGLGGYVF